MKVFEKKIVPQSMSKAAFCDVAVALPVPGELNAWQVYFGQDYVQSVSAKNAHDALEVVHLDHVQKALIKHMIKKENADVTDIPSTSALADYPDLVATHANAVWLAIVTERDQREQSLSRERQAISALVEMVEGLMKAPTTRKELAELVSVKLKPAREILQSNAAVSDREEALARVLRELLDSFDSGAIEGGEQMFELARSFVECSGTPTFLTWIANVARCLSTDEVESSSYRCFYEKGMTPSEAVLAERLGSGVMSH